MKPFKELFVINDRSTLVARGADYCSWIYMVIFGLAIAGTRHPKKFGELEIFMSILIKWPELNWMFVARLIYWNRIASTASQINSAVAAVRLKTLRKPAKCINVIRMPVSTRESGRGLANVCMMFCIKKEILCSSSKTTIVK